VRCGLIDISQIRCEAWNVPSEIVPRDHDRRQDRVLLINSGVDNLCLANCYLTHDSSGFQLNVTMFHCIETCHRINSPGTT
jgi:hypothetical protein